MKRSNNQTRVKKSYVEPQITKRGHIAEITQAGKIQKSFGLTDSFNIQVNQQDVGHS
jgi:hypothetical protein